MNLERLKKLRHSLANTRITFSMGMWSSCFYAHASRTEPFVVQEMYDRAYQNELVKSLSNTNTDDMYDPEIPAFAEWLGVDLDTAELITLGRWSRHRIGYITREEALEYLDQLIDQEEKALYLELPKLEAKVKEPEPVEVLA